MIYYGGQDVMGFVRWIGKGGGNCKISCSVEMAGCCGLTGLGVL